MIAEIWDTPVGQAYSDFEVAAFVERVLAATATPGVAGPHG